MKIQKHLYLLAILMMAAVTAGFVPAVASAGETGSNLAVSLTADKAEAKTGDNVTFTYVVSNTGSVVVENLTVTDNRTGSIVLSRESLGVGENVTGTVVRLVKPADFPGPLMAGFMAAGVSATGDNVTTSGSVAVTLKAGDADDDDEGNKDDDEHDQGQGTRHDGERGQGNKADWLREKGAHGKGIDHAPGLQKSFNEHWKGGNASSDSVPRGQKNEHSRNNSDD